MRVFSVTVVLLFCLQFSVAQIIGSDLQIRADDGGTVAVRTAGGWVNQDSSLKRTWYVVDDPNAPARLDRAGVFPDLEEKESIHYFVPLATVSPKQAVAAVEVRYILFNVWGERIRTLSVTRLVDSATHIDIRERHRFPAMESEASQVVKVFAFISRVLTADGHTWSVNPDELLREMGALGLTCTSDELNPDERRFIDPNLSYWTYIPAKREISTKSSEPGPRQPRSR